MGRTPREMGSAPLSVRESSQSPAIATGQLRNPFCKIGDVIPTALSKFRSLFVVCLSSEHDVVDVL
jgi:hypothetical protein